MTPTEPLTERMKYDLGETAWRNGVRTADDWDAFKGPNREPLHVSRRRRVARELFSMGYRPIAIAQMLRRDHTTIRHLLTEDGWMEKRGERCTT